MTTRVSDPEIQVVFDRHLPSARRLGYKLTLKKPYTGALIDGPKGLYRFTDDAGTNFNISIYGSSYANGGYWHIVGVYDPDAEDD